MWGAPGVEAQVAGKQVQSGRAPIAGRHTAAVAQSGQGDQGTAARAHLQQPRACACLHAAYDTSQSACQRVPNWVKLLSTPGKCAAEIFACYRQLHPEKHSDPAVTDCVQDLSYQLRHVSAVLFALHALSSLLLLFWPLLNMCLS